MTTCTGRVGGGVGSNAFVRLSGGFRRREAVTTLSGWSAALAVAAGSHPTLKISVYARHRPGYRAV
jgi:hypothetical protein